MRMLLARVGGRVDQLQQQQQQQQPNQGKGKRKRTQDNDSGGGGPSEEEDENNRMVIDSAFFGNEGRKLDHLLNSL